MPRYFFNIHDGVDIADPVGTEYPSWKEAYAEAIRLVGQVLKDDAAHIALGESWHLEVTNEQGAVLFRLDFKSTKGPALTGAFRAEIPAQA